MTTFALAHGAWHGAWCWERVAPLLQRAGHDVVAPDLPCEDGAADFDRYADAMCAALQGCDDDVVVVGHSLGGPTATLVAARRPARHVVYLCAVVLEVGVSLMDQGPEQMAAEFADGWLNGLSKPDEQGRMTWVDFDFVRKVFYPDCDEPTAAAAIDHLRPQAVHPWMQRCSLAELPSVPCTYVLCAEDQVLSVAWSRRTARRIGADIVELPGGHSPLLSRPTAVADVLLQLT
jgi:pimeloyl-ACP methyl ester carboxylesterase